MARVVGGTEAHFTGHGPEVRMPRPRQPDPSSPAPIWILSHLPDAPCACAPSRSRTARNIRRSPALPAAAKRPKASSCRSSKAHHRRADCAGVFPGAGKLPPSVPAPSSRAPNRRKAARNPRRATRPRRRRIRGSTRGEIFASRRRATPERSNRIACDAGRRRFRRGCRGSHRARSRGTVRRT